MMNKLKHIFKRFNYIFIVLALAVITFYIYCPVVWHDYITLDDHVLIFENQVVANLRIDTIKDFFLKEHFGMYHPLVSLSLALDYKIAGWAAPYIFHSSNLIIHIFNTLFVLLLFYLITKNIYASFFIALAFSIHPMHVEPVAWISERKEVLHAFFYIPALIFYILYRKDGNFYRIFYISSIILFLCALMSKPMAMTLPFVCVLYDYVFERKIYIKDKILFIITAALFSLVAVIVQSYHPHAESIFVSIYNNLYKGAYQYSFYIYKFFLPIHLSLLYPYGAENSVSYYKPLTIIFLIFWTALTAFCFKRNKKIFFGILFFTLTILPMLNIVPFGLRIPNDRFTYIPYLGLFYSCYIAIRLLNNKMNMKTVKQITALVLAAVFIFYFAASSKRVGQWINSTVLYEDGIKKYPNKFSFFHTTRAIKYYDIGDKRAALADYMVASALEPFSSDNYLNIGNLYSELGYIEKALEYYRLASHFDTDNKHSEYLYDLERQIYNMLIAVRKEIEGLKIDKKNTKLLHMKSAEIYYRYGFFFAAIDELNILLSQYPNDVEAKRFLENAVTMSSPENAFVQFVNLLRWKESQLGPEAFTNYVREMSALNTVKENTVQKKLEDLKKFNESNLIYRNNNATTLGI